MRKEISALKDVSSAISPSLNELRRELGESQHQDQVVPLLWSEALVIALEEVEAMRKDIPCRIETCRAEVLDAASQLRKTTTLLSEDVVHCRAETNAINECLESVKQELANGLTDCEFSPDTARLAQYDELALKAKDMKHALISNGDNLADMYSKSNTLNEAIDVGQDKNVFQELALVAEDSDEEIFLMEEDVTDDRQPVKVWAFVKVFSFAQGALVHVVSFCTGVRRRVVRVPFSWCSQAAHTRESLDLGRDTKRRFCHRCFSCCLAQCEFVGGLMLPHACTKQ